MNNFKQRVMDIAEREINGRTDINFMYAWKKTGRSVTSIRFEFACRRANRSRRCRGPPLINCARLEEVAMPREEAERLCCASGRMLILIV